MTRIFISPEFIKGQKIELTDRKSIHYIVDVLRLKRGDSINIFDGKGSEYLAVIGFIRPKEIEIEVSQKNKISKKSGPEITLVQALPKKGLFEFIIEKATELGVDKIIPVITERTIPDISKKSGERFKRWQIIIEGAARQCGRSDIPTIIQPLPFDSAVEISNENDLSLFACIEKETEKLKNILKEKLPKKIAIFVGPEGDFSKEEVLKARASGCRLVWLGDNILRVETAAINLLSIVRYEFL